MKKTTSKLLSLLLALTLVLEELFALLWGLRGRRELTVVALVNVLTNPPVVLLCHTAVGLWGWNASPPGRCWEPLSSEPSGSTSCFREKSAG